jgi:hypothetical protein
MIAELERCRRPGWKPRASYPAAIGSIRFGSLFSTLPTRVLTGQHGHPLDD